MFKWNRLGYGVIAGLLLTLTACGTKEKPQPPTNNVEPKDVEQASPSTPEEQVAKLMKEFNLLLEEGKYQEAAKVAHAAYALAPDDPAANAAVIMASTLNRSKITSPGEGKEFNLLLEEGKYQEAAKVAHAAYALAPDDPAANAAVIMMRPGGYHRAIDPEDPIFQGLIDSKPTRPTTGFIVATGMITGTGVIVLNDLTRSQDWGTSAAESRATPLPLGQSRPGSDPYYGGAEFLFMHKDLAIGPGVVAARPIVPVAEKGVPIHSFIIGAGVTFDSGSTQDWGTAGKLNRPK